jgi:hypothetical protein
MLPIFSNTPDVIDGNNRQGFVDGAVREGILTMLERGGDLLQCVSSSGPVSP